MLINLLELPRLRSCSTNLYVIKLKPWVGDFTNIVPLKKKGAIKTFTVWPLGKSSLMLVLDLQSDEYSQLLWTYMLVRTLYRSQISLIFLGFSVRLKLATRILWIKSQESRSQWIPIWPQRRRQECLLRICRCLRRIDHDPEERIQEGRESLAYIHVRKTNILHSGNFAPLLNAWKMKGAAGAFGGIITSLIDLPLKPAFGQSRCRYD